MKKLFLFVLVAFAMTVVSCGGGSQQPQQYVADESDSTESYYPHDQTIYGICGDTAKNVLNLLTDNGDTISLDITKALAAGQVLGGRSRGDRMAVLTNKARTEAIVVINQNTLLGDWVMPNPIDGSSEVGIRIKEGGIAESIDQSSIIYKTWRIYNGKLEILSQRDGGGDMEEYALYDILMLGPDTLVYRSSGVAKQDEETFEYSRWKEKPELDLHGLKLEDSSDEFRIDF